MTLTKTKAIKTNALGLFRKCWQHHDPHQLGTGFIILPNVKLLLNAAAKGLGFIAFWDIKTPKCAKLSSVLNLLLNVLDEILRVVLW